MFSDSLDFIENFDFNSPSNLPKWSAVKKQAARHTRGIGVKCLLEQQRPNESDFIRDYRLSNIRNITQEGAVKFNDKTSRIINSSNFSIQNLSNELAEWISNNKFDLGNGEKVNITEYFSRFILSYSFEDPNAILLAFPFNKENKNIAPALPLEQGGLAANMSVSVEPRIIQSEDIVYNSNTVFSFVDDYNYAYKAERKIKTAKSYFVVDQNSIYYLIPIGEKKENRKIKVVYDTILWYNHNTNEIPAIVLGGTVSICEETKEIYNESFLKPFFEYADEALVTFSDFQAVKVKTAYPVKVLKKRPCIDCNGQGKVRVKTKDGESLNNCDSCGGHGFMKDLSPFSDIVIENDSFDKGSNIKALEYVSPDVAILKFLDETWRALIDDAKKSINLDLLVNMSESGEAMKQRLQDLQDLLKKIGSNTFDLLQSFLKFTEVLLNPVEANRSIPTIIQPITYEIKNEQILREEIKDTAFNDRFTSLMDFYRKKYRGNDLLIRIKELAIIYAPLLLFDNIQDIQVRILGAYSDADLIKRDRAEILLLELSKEIDILNTSNEVIFNRLDEMINRFLPLSAIPLFEDEDADTRKITVENQAKLKGTVGGITGIININRAVAIGEMSESSAERILVEIYGLTEEVARSIIESPNTDFNA